VDLEAFASGGPIARAPEGATARRADTAATEDARTTAGIVTRGPDRTRGLASAVEAQDASTTIDDDEF
jgi:hypothetical protein